MFWSDKIQITNEDNMELMARYPDKYFDLAIVDPPYGIGGGVDNRKAIETKSGNNLKRLARKGGMEWDRNTPNKKYFNELFRVSKNQIVWGGNYMIENLENTRCFIVWDKMTYIPSMSQIELAWSSFTTHSQLVKINSNQNERIHISQKPVALYKWLLDKYAKQGDKILDTHLGSGSIAIACHDYGFELTACELDTEYYEAAKKRFLNHSAQTKLFLS
jgi:site-specific DNA-methyltransferase (adenine-specific)